MNCDEFGERMHQCLDDRLSVDSDRELRRHANACDSCRLQMQAWHQIAKIIPGSQIESRDTALARLRREKPSILGVMAPLTACGAAAILVAVTVYWYGTSLATSDTLLVADSNIEVVDSVELSEHAMALAQVSGQLDPAVWWESVQDRDWIGQTMPTVQSVKEGVAPIGRSLMRAVTILTIGGRDQTS